jgi:hypothetical protein
VSFTGGTTTTGLGFIFANDNCIIQYKGVGIISFSFDISNTGFVVKSKAF